MDWIKGLIALVIIIGWIVGNLKERQKAAEKAAPPPLPLPPLDPYVAAPVRKADDLQEFLKQIRRRSGEPEPQTTAEPLPAVLVEEAPRIESLRSEVPPVILSPKPRKKIRPDSPPKTPRRKPDALPPTSERVVFSGPLASDSAPTTSGSKVKSAAVRDAVRLLKSPAGLKTAFILQEILSEPLAKRRRRH